MYEKVERQVIVLLNNNSYNYFDKKIVRGTYSIGGVI